MSKLVAELEAAGLVAKEADADDRRGVVIAATAAGKKLMLEGRSRRLALLKQKLQGLTREEIAELKRAAPVLLKLAGR
jgi:DNA-binding MarR family transcriptional regulator